MIPPRVGLWFRNDRCTILPESCPMHVILSCLPCLARTSSLKSSIGFRSAVQILINWYCYLIIFLMCWQCLQKNEGGPTCKQADWPAPAMCHARRLSPHDSLHIMLTPALMSKYSPQGRYTSLRHTIPDIA